MFPDCIALKHSKPNVLKKKMVLAVAKRKYIVGAHLR